MDDMPRQTMSFDRFVTVFHTQNTIKPMDQKASISFQKKACLTEMNNNIQGHTLPFFNFLIVES